MFTLWVCNGSNMVMFLCYNAATLQTEMMSDSIDDALDNDEAEEETEELTQQVWFLFQVFQLLPLYL